MYFIIQLSDEFSYIPKTSERCFEYGEVSYYETFFFRIINLEKSSDKIDFTFSQHFLLCLQYQVWLEFSQETNEMTTSKLRINHTQSRRYRSVWHICWNDFDDQMCPKYVSGFLGELMLDESVTVTSYE